MSSFIPKDYKAIPVTVRIPEDKLETINNLLKKLNISRNKFFNQCIDYAMANMEIKDCDLEKPIEKK